MDLYYNKTQRSIQLILLASLILGCTYGIFALASSSVKMLFSGLTLLSMLFFPYALIWNNDFDKITKNLFIGIIILSLVEVARTGFSSDPDLNALGNKWITLFGNEYCFPLLIPPLFICLAAQDEIIQLSKKYLHYFLLFGVLFSVLGKLPLAFMVIIISPFWNYANKTDKILMLIVVLESLAAAFMGSNPTRAMLLYLFFALVAYILVYIIKKTKLIKLFCITFCILPVLLFVPLLYNSEATSYFISIQNYIMDQTGDADMANDTRTFLYLEMAEDLTNSNSWILGKGAFCHYYSLFFDQDVNGQVGRISSEVPVLNLLMHGGLSYCFCYFGLILLSIYKALKYGNNKFIQCIAILATGWFFSSFVGDITGCRFYHIIFFILIGCCLSDSWLNKTDEDIQEIFCA